MMRMGHYLRVAWLLTKLGENSVLLERELEQVKRRILLLRNISDVQHLRQSMKYIKKFISTNCIVKQR